MSSDYLCINWYGSSLGVYTRVGVPRLQCLGQYVQLLYSLLVSPHSNNSTKDCQRSIFLVLKKLKRVSLQLIQQHYLAHLKLIRATFDNSHSSNGNHTTVYTSSLPNSHSGKDTTKQTSQVHSQAGSQARQHLGWQKTGVSKIGDGSPSSPGIN